MYFELPAVEAGKRYTGRTSPSCPLSFSRNQRSGLPLYMSNWSEVRWLVRGRAWIDERQRLARDATRRCPGYRARRGDSPSTDRASRATAADLAREARRRHGFLDEVEDDVVELRFTLAPARL